MKTTRLWKLTVFVSSLLVTVGVLASVTVKTVPWVPSDSTIPHDTYSGKTVTLKGTCNVAGPTIQWTWDFGDGSAVASGTVTDNYDVEAQHAYTGADGMLYTARLTVLDTSTSETASKPYYVIVHTKALQVEVNVAIDEGLWYLHKDMTRWNDGTFDLGYWDSWKYGYASGLGYPALDAENICAFEVQGHLETGSPDDPYTETVQRGLRYFFETLSVSGTLPLKTIPSGTWNPDQNGNGFGIYANSGYTLYQGGMMIDCIIASGTPNAVTATGVAGVVSRKYADIVQDLVDWYLYAQYTGSAGGGWRYNPGDYPDNSVCQWAAIGMIPAEREWGLSVPQWAKDWNLVWLANSQDEGGGGLPGAFPYYPGYWYPWGPYATTPSGMVQMSMDHIGRGSNPGGWPNWDMAETFMRDNFANTGGPTQAIKSYYYGMFSFVKSMLLHWDIINNVQAPIVMLQSSTPLVPPIDWYAAEVSNGSPTDGVARTLVDGQDGGGFWWNHNVEGEQFYFETAWAIQMLSKTVFQPGGVPVAVPVATPNPGLAGQVITLDGSASYDKAPGHVVVKWEWDVNGDGIFEGNGSVIMATFAGLGVYPVTLRVTDDSTPTPLTAEATVMVNITIPPVPPTANAGGPYVFCPQAKPWFLDGRLSINPDDGKHQPGPYPGDYIKSYAWDLNGDNVFGDVTGSTPDVTSFFDAAGPGTYVVQLKVTDNTAASFPVSGLGDLSSTASATVIVKAATDPDCACVTLKFVADGKDVQMSWTALPGAASYGVYRSLTSGGPYAWIGSSSTLSYTDNTAVSGMTYYYIVRPLAVNGNELCQSNEISATPVCDPPVVRCVPTTKVSNNPRYYRMVLANSDCFDEVAIKIYVGDTLTPAFVAGPYVDEDVLRISPGATATVKPGSYGVTAIITVKGKATVWGVDPLGGKSIVILSP